MMYLFDNITTGHHMDYANELLKIDGCKLIFKEMKFNKNPLSVKYFKDRFEFIKDCLQYDNIHFLYFDNLYFIFSLINIKKDKKIIATIHHTPKSKIGLFLIKIASKRITHLIVHSNFQKEALDKLGLKNVIVIEYPSFINYNLYSSKSDLKKEFNIPEDKIVISLLGATRKDKGLDNFLNSLSFISDSIRKIILVNIAGKESYFKKAFIEKKLIENKVSFSLNLNFVINDEFAKRVKISDIVILPYNENFSGSSGPMIEAISLKIPVITPKNSNLGKITEYYNCGLTYKDLPELALILEKLISSNYVFDNNYNSSTSIFKEKYSKLYKSI